MSPGKEYRGLGFSMGKQFDTLRSKVTLQTLYEGSNHLLLTLFSSVFLEKLNADKAVPQSETFGALNSKPQGTNRTKPEPEVLRV